MPDRPDALARLEKWLKARAGDGLSLVRYSVGIGGYHVDLSFYDHRSGEGPTLSDAIHAALDKAEADRG